MIYLSIYLSHGGCPWGANVELKTSRLHPSLSSACLIASPILSPVHSVTLSSHLFLCLPLFLCPLAVPWMKRMLKVKRAHKILTHVLSVIY